MAARRARGARWPRRPARGCGGGLASWRDPPEEEARQLALPLLDERAERLVALDAEHDGEHRARREREDAERDEVDEELPRVHRTHAAGADLLADLRAEAREDAGRHPIELDAGERVDELLCALGVLVHLAEDVARQVRGAAERVELVVHDPPDLLVDREVGAEDGDDR